MGNPGHAALIISMGANIGPPTIQPSHDIVPGYPEFSPSCRSLLREHLTPEVYEQLRDCVTPGGVTLEKLIASGVVHQDSSVGAYAGDADSYSVFAPLLDPMIAGYHTGAHPHVLHATNACQAAVCTACSCYTLSLKAGIMGLSRPLRQCHAGGDIGSHAAKG